MSDMVLNEAANFKIGALNSNPIWIKFSARKSSFD